MLKKTQSQHPLNLQSIFDFNRLKRENTILRKQLDDMEAENNALMDTMETKMAKLYRRYD